MKIYSLDGTVLFDYKTDSLRKCIEVAVAMNIDLSFSDFRGRHLVGLNVPYGTFRGSSFKGAILSNAKFLSCNLMFCNFDYAYMHGAILDNSNLSCSILRHTVFNKASFFMSDLTETNFSYSTLYAAKGLKKHFHGEHIHFGDNLSNPLLRFFDYSSPDRKIKTLTYSDGSKLNLDFGFKKSYN